MREIRPPQSQKFFSRIFVDKIWIRAYLCKEKNYVFVDLRKLYVHKKKLGPQIANTQITKRIDPQIATFAEVLQIWLQDLFNQKFHVLQSAEKPAETQNSLRGQLANWSERLTTIIENVSSNPLHGHEISALITKNIYLWGTVFYIGDSDLIISCLTCSTLSVWLRLYNSRTLARHWETCLLGRLTCPTPREIILLYTQVQYQRGTGGSSAEKPAETLTSLPG